MLYMSVTNKCKCLNIIWWISFFGRIMGYLVRLEHLNLTKLLTLFSQQRKISEKNPNVNIWLYLPAITFSFLYEVAPLHWIELAQFQLSWLNYDIFRLNINIIWKFNKNNNCETLLKIFDFVKFKTSAYWKNNRIAWVKKMLRRP